VIILVVIHFLFCSIAWAESSVSYRSLEQEIRKLLAEEEGTYGVYILDLHTQQFCGINQEVVFHAASTFKIPMNLFLFQQIALNKINPQLKLTYKPQHYEGGTGILQFARYGTSYTIYELAKYSMVYSDNVATNMLLGYLGRKNVKDFMRSLGGKVVDDRRNITCPRDMAYYMKALVAFWENYPEYGSILLNHLENTVFNERIPKLLPSGTRVAHKIGNWPATGSYHDVGIVFHPTHPYIISLFSKGVPDRTHCFRVLQNLSLLVYNTQSRLQEATLVVNGQELDPDVPPVVTGDTVYIPIRFLAESLGLEIFWNPQEKWARIRGKRNVVLRAGTREIWIDNSVFPGSLPIENIAGRIMVPLNLVEQMFDVSVTWDQEASLVEIRST